MVVQIYALSGRGGSEGGGYWASHDEAEAEVACAPMTHGEMQTKGQKEGPDSEGRRRDLQGRVR